MTQPVAPAPSIALSLPGGTMPMANGNAGPSADFSAVLAVQADEPSLAGSDEALLSAAPVLTAEAASTGKILPPVLPQSPVVLEDPVDPETSTPAAAAFQMVRLEPVVGKHGKAAKTDATAKSAAAGLASEGLIEAAASTRDTMLAAAAPSTDLAVALAQPTAETAPSAPITAPVAVGKPAQDSTTDPKADHAKFGQGAVHRTVPTLPASASATAQAQMQRHAAATPPTQPEPEPPAVQPAATGVTALVPAEEVRVEVALPRLALAGVLTRDDTRANTRLPDLALPDAAGPLGAGPVPAPVPGGGAVPAAPIPQVRPHDFAALIERIAVARDAAASQAVSITVAHQDFGPVRLNFWPEDSGLSIAMSSADPGFARAAAAAPAPVLPVTSSEQAQLSQHQRSENGAAQAGGQSQSQSRGSSPDQRRDGQPQPNPAPRRNHSNPAPRTGIFA